MTNESQKTFDAIRTLALKDLDATSEEEIRTEFFAEGIDPDQLAASIAVSLDEILAASLRQQTAAAKVAMQVLVRHRPGAACGIRGGCDSAGVTDDDP